MILFSCIIIHGKKYGIATLESATVCTVFVFDCIVYLCMFFANIKNTIQYNTIDVITVATLKL